ncbi:unnamed protein product [Somion occarium]|uniref:ATP synthase subunit e, mitochondrial n=1 Tax=Somion occarium TaxID=3059160 RepID=A0ABP1CY75_9APHY
MNTPQSMFLGWGSLIVAAGVSYYWAKKGIDERRLELAKAGARPTEKLDWRSRIEKYDGQPAPVPAAVASASGNNHTPAVDQSTRKDNPP